MSDKQETRNPSATKQYKLLITNMTSTEFHRV